MNKPLRWGLGLLAGVFIGNLVWHFALQSPSARFFTSDWWQRWVAIYAVAFIAIVIGVILLAFYKSRANDDGKST